MAPRRSIIPHRDSDAWMFAVPDTVPEPYTPIDDSWCAQFADNPADLSAIRPREQLHRAKIRRTSQQPDCTETQAPELAKGTSICVAEAAADAAGPTVSSSAFISDACNKIRKYRMQSPAHFAVRINVEIDAEDVAYEFVPARRIKALFSTGFGRSLKEVYRICRVNPGQNGRSILDDKIFVREKRWTGKKRWVLLDKSLRMNFPPDDRLVNQHTMERYWATNGKTFNWAGLPTELKEGVLQFCVSDLSSYKDEFHGYPAAEKLSPRAHQDRVRHPSEVMQRLGDWKSLLSVSKQTRALALYLLFNGSDAYPQGFCVTSDDYAGFGQRLRRLNEYYQMTQPDSVVKPGDRDASIHACMYSQFPKIYTELERYATFKHGIRKVWLQFDILGYLDFFKSMAGLTMGIDIQRPEHGVTCDVFNQLPHLNQIIVDLPPSDNDYPGRVGPLLPHLFNPYPRILHRLIYEQAALQLAAYEDVTVRFFADTGEERHFTALRAAARLALRVTAVELTELYADDGGGIQLDKLPLGS